MKAIVYHDYGSSDVLKLEEVPKPSPKNNQVLIKIHAASLNPLDWRLMSGKPRLARVMASAVRMNTGTPGVDAAGVIEEVGKDVKEFKPGDAVFGGVLSACAEYGCARASKVALKPESVTFEQAATVNVAGLTSLQAVRDKAKVQPGEHVLVNGAGGGVGTFAVQIAKVFGAHVTGVCSTGKLEMVRSIGADAVIDYTKEDFVDLPTRYDVILQCVGNKSIAELRRALKPNGRVVLIGAPHEPSMMQLFGPLIEAALLSPFRKQKAIPMVGKANAKDLSFLGELIATGKLNPVIDHCYPLSETAEAMRYLEDGHAGGKLIIKVA